MRKSKIPLKCAIAIALAVSFSQLNTRTHAEEQEEIAIMVKLGGIAWFTAMEDGIKEGGKEQDAIVYLVGPATADAAQQLRAVEDLIGKKINAISVLRNDAKAFIDEGPLVLEAFAANNPDLIGTTRLWYPGKYAPKEFATRGPEFLKANVARAGLL
jgi:hypothetical protein